MDYRNISNINKLRRPRLRQIVRRSLKEDIGKRDITTELVIPKDKFVKAVLLAKESCVVCGLDIASLVFKLKDSKTKFKPLIKDGQVIKKGKALAKIQGRARPILTAERVALNFLSLLSGIATQTKKYVDRVKPYKVKIMDTRKTIPGLRELQKYAVRVGGGFNHRMQLDEMVLVKDNHIKVQSSKFKIQSLIRKKIPKKMKIEIEVKNLREFKEALKAGPDIIMLDNMKISDIKKAVKIRRNTMPVGRQAQYAIPHLLRQARRNTLLEASGGITLKNVKKIAACGVDMISVGDLTHSTEAIDMSMEML